MARVAARKKPIESVHLVLTTEQARLLLDVARYQETVSNQWIEWRAIARRVRAALTGSNGRG